MTPSCARCRERVSHCHGTLILHVTAGSACSDPDCRELDMARHDLVVFCSSVDAGCVDCVAYLSSRVAA